jgi:hypothetical protein
VLVQDVSNRAGSEAGFLRYAVADDRWEQLPPPSLDAAWYQLVATPTTVLAFSGSDEAGEKPDLEFDPRTGTWMELPPDPLSPSFDRSMVVVGEDVYLFAQDLVANPNSEKPSLARAAHLDLATGEWEHRADSEVLGSWFSVAVGSTIVFPHAGSADGGEVNNWGRSYAYGGIYNPETDTWAALPSPARENGFAIAGVLEQDAATYLSMHGAVLDATQTSWQTIPELPIAEVDVFSRTIVAAGIDLFVFGGEAWAQVEGSEFLNGANGSVLGDAYLWRPSH